MEYFNDINRTHFWILIKKNEKLNVYEDIFVDTFNNIYMPIKERFSPFKKVYQIFDDKKIYINNK